MSEDDFAEELAAPTPTPGGGAAAARVGLYATSLLRMVAGISLAKLSDEDERCGLIEIRREAERLAADFRRLEKEDIAAFEAYLSASRLPRSTEEEKAWRRVARQRAAMAASTVPLELMESAREVFHLAARLMESARRGIVRAESDLGGAVELAGAAFRAAALTLEANLPELSAEDLAAVEKRYKGLQAEAQGIYRRLSSIARAE